VIYILYVAYIVTASGVPHPQQVGPFKGIIACEHAAAQVQAVDNRIRSTVCLSLNHKPMHWNGKELPK
jgi:hypothetical protein